MPIGDLVILKYIFQSNIVNKLINKIPIFNDTKRNTHSIAAADILCLIMRKKIF